VNETDYFRQLKDVQYADGSNLKARAQLHERYRQNKSGLHTWIFDQLLDRSGTRLLEVGCGPGYFWRENLNRIPQNWRITVSDLSTGMLGEIRKVVGGTGARFELLTCDAQSLPCRTGTFDTVIANHMLYHLRDVNDGVDEIFRVLGPDGAVLASTNGADHMQEIRDLVHSLSNDVIFGSADIRRGAPRTFSRENGADVLGRRFSRVQWFDFDDALVVTDVDPLIRYILSFPGNAGEVFAPRKMYRRLNQAIADRMDREGAFHISKSTGLFVASKT
jgi:SAM-dependent methyltransferase